MNITSESVIAIGGVIGAILTCIYYAQNISKNFKKEKEELKAEILQEAKEADEKLKLTIESRMSEIEITLENLRENVEKDLGHMREQYNGEIRNLGHKIEDLRTELRTQHGQLVQLLSKMIDSRE